MSTAAIASNAAALAGTTSLRKKAARLSSLVMTVGLGKTSRSDPREPSHGR